MSTGAIIAIIVVAVIVVVLFAVVMPRVRAGRREREIARRREEVAGAHREVADQRMARAERAERLARAERAEAELHSSRAELHEQGLADDELDDAPEPGRFERDRETDRTPEGERTS
jgi:type II secretory pathway pseudopilin PulG